MSLESITPREIHRPVSFVALLFGASAAPLFWLGQLLLAYMITAQACYPGDHPEHLTSPALLNGVMMGFDIIAILFSLLGGGIAWLCLVRIGRARNGTAKGRARFLAIWGIFSSICFLIGIVFTTIASATVPLCVT
jgi:hypothetical protein